MCFEIWTIILMGFILNLHISLDVVEGEKNEKNWYVSSCNLLIEICISQYFFCYRRQIASRTIYPCQFTDNSVLLHEKFIEMVILFVYVFDVETQNLIVILSIHVNFAPNKCSNWLSENWQLSSERSLFAIRG